MRQVTEEEFYHIVNANKLDVCPQIVGKYPYTSIFKYRDGREFGRVVGGGSLGEPSYLYFVNWGEIK